MSAATSYRLQPPARSFGIVGGVAWTEEEREVLRALYEKKGCHACAKALPLRSVHAICQAARRMGLKTHKRWTATDDRILRSEWGYMSVAKIGRALGRTAKAVYQRAKEIDLGLGAPEGSEYLTAASRRSGFAVATLRRVLAYSGVLIRPVPSRPHGPVGHRMHYVDPFDVDEAVAAWMDSEDIEPAAKARGMSGETLARWLHDAGVEDPRTLARGRWRVPSATIDRVVSERRSARATSEGIAAAARRHNVHPGTLREWLIRSGIRMSGKPWMLDPGVVDHVVKARRRP